MFLIDFQMYYVSLFFFSTNKARYAKWFITLNNDSFGQCSNQNQFYYITLQLLTTKRHLLIQLIACWSVLYNKNCKSVLQIISALGRHSASIDVFGYSRKICPAHTLYYRRGSFMCTIAVVFTLQFTLLTKYMCQI